MFLSNRNRTVHYYTRLFAYSSRPPSPRYYTVWHEIFAVMFFDDPPKFDNVQLNSRKSIDTELYYIFYMNGSPQTAIFYLHFFTMTKSLGRHHLLVDRYHRRKFVRNTKRNESVIGKNETLAKMSCHVVYFHRLEQQFDHFTCSL